RVIQPDFISTLSKVMKKDAILHIASDKKDLSEDMREILNSSKAFKTMFSKDDWAPENIPGFFSDIEYYHVRKNNPIYRLQYKKVSSQ
ncbi:MAG: hypothetical protein KKA19_08770, partial [Candidatus Margulisbacteria bacterium]|nr:hypothetical protein [Candidatus Margulisiibacteriota bacterium]